jgi:hypothetical protein
MNLFRRNNALGHTLGEFSANPSGHPAPNLLFLVGPTSKQKGRRLGLTVVTMEAEFRMQRLRQPGLPDGIHILYQKLQFWKALKLTILISFRTIWYSLPGLPDVINIFIPNTKFWKALELKYFYSFYDHLVYVHMYFVVICCNL